MNISSILHLVCAFNEKDGEQLFLGAYVFKSYPDENTHNCDTSTISVVSLDWREKHSHMPVSFLSRCKQGIDQQIFNRKSISRKITHPQS